MLVISSSLDSIFPTCVSNVVVLPPCIKENKISLRIVHWISKKINKFGCFKTKKKGYKPTNAFLKLTKAYASHPTQIIGMHLVMSPWHGYDFGSKSLRCLIQWKWNMSRYTSIGFEGFKEILIVFVNIYSYSYLATTTILVRKGFFALFFFYITHTH